MKSIFTVITDIEDLRSEDGSLSLLKYFERQSSYNKTTGLYAFTLKEWFILSFLVPLLYFPYLINFLETKFKIRDNLVDNILAHFAFSLSYLSLAYVIYDRRLSKLESWVVQRLNKVWFNSMRRIIMFHVCFFLFCFF